MNIYGIVILAAIIVDFIIDSIAKSLNIKQLKSDLPVEFAGVYTDETFRKSQEYTKTNTIFNVITTLFDLILLLGFWFAGGFNRLDGIVRVISEYYIWQGLLYIGILMFANAIISLPFGIYSTFVIEERFGFNKTTPGTFVLDLIKSLGLSIVIGAPVLALILYILQNAGSYAWIAGWSAVTIISFIMQYLYPRLIMPIFNKFVPLEDGELKSSIMSYAHKVKFPLKNIFVMDGSRRSGKSNAFFTGIGKNKRIALYDTLIEKHTIGELVAVLAHEIGHFKKKHILVGMIVGILHTGFLFYLLNFFITEPGLFGAFYMDNISIYAGLIFFGMLYSPVNMLLSLVMNIVSRSNERAADKFA
ncbi:MAG: endopeptidase, partial [Bacteroidota bacterium]|nr:endopeptidase [Bacteroidota bacterium]